MCYVEQQVVVVVSAEGRFLGSSWLVEVVVVIVQQCVHVEAGRQAVDRQAGRQRRSREFTPSCTPSGWSVEWYP